VPAKNTPGAAQLGVGVGVGVLVGVGVAVLVGVGVGKAPHTPILEITILNSLALGHGSLGVCEAQNEPLAPVGHVPGGFMD